MFKKKIKIAEKTLAEIIFLAKIFWPKKGFGQKKGVDRITIKSEIYKNLQN